MTYIENLKMQKTNLMTGTCEIKTTCNLSTFKSF